MSTRGVYGFRVEGVEKVTFCRWDAYPEGLGLTMLEWAQSHSVDDMEAIARNLVLVSGDDRPTAEESTATAMFSMKHVPSDECTWDCQLYESRGDPAAWDRGLRYITDDGLELHHPGTDCEWGYLIDLDWGRFEVYARLRPWGQDGFGSPLAGLVRMLSFPLRRLPPAGGFLRTCNDTAEALWALLARRE